MNLKSANKILIGLLALLSFSCASYYQINWEFNQDFERGNIEAARKVLDKNKKAGRKKTQFLYYANQGVVNYMLGDYEKSNEWLEKAYIFGEDYHKNYANIAASFLVNPNTITYPGEDHEHLLLLYYKALNYLKLKNYEAALVECRRLNLRLNELSDKYRSDNKYKRDAFIHNLMGIIYEASGDVNNAFIAYRNALEIYETDYRELFQVNVPNQLKLDLLRTAYLNGFSTELDFYENKFNKKYEPQSANAQELVFFWQNGLGPVKAEWSINFTALDGGDGFITFANDEYDFSFPYQISDPNQKSDLTDLRLFRVSFPKYRDRGEYFQKGTIEVSNQQYPLNLGENVNAIARKTLEERMLQEFAKGLLRAATKKALEAAIRGDQSGDDKDKTREQKQEEAFREGLSLLVGVMNAATEKADTRNWQTIPYSIYYTRVPMEVGDNTVKLITESAEGKKDQVNFSFDIAPKETVFHMYHSLESAR